MRHLRDLLCLILLAILVGTPGLAKDRTPSAVLATDSIPIASYTFDDGMGGPDPMGWTTIDFTEQDGTFFHVDNFAGLGGGSFGGLMPLRGNQSLWCGTRPTLDLCYYATLPGYGSAWDQHFVSTLFAVSGDVNVSFLARFDSEWGYDQTHLDYLTKSGRWETLGVFDEGPAFPGFADSLVSETIPADSLDAVVQVRFRFTSDGTWDDENGLWDTDGAVIVDSLVISDAGGIVDYQDFEAEAVGDLVTADGDWAAGVAAGFGDFASLFDGTMVLQEDTTTTNTSYFWGFFLGSPDNYTCGGHPEQLIVPLANAENGRIDNGAVSPVFDITSLVSGPGSLSAMLVEYDVYKDFAFLGWPFSSYVLNPLDVRAYVDGCWGDWQNVGTVAGGFGEWDRVAFDIAPAITPGTTKFQIALRAIDIGGFDCHSHAPLIDNVNLYAWLDTVVTDVGDPPTWPNAYSLQQNHPNPFNPSTVIQYDVPSPGAAVVLRVYDVQGRLIQTLSDDFVPAGRHAVTWDGTNRHGGRVASGVYFYHLETPGFTGTRKMVLIE